MCCLEVCRYLICCVNDRLCLSEVVCFLTIIWWSLCHTRLCFMTTWSIIARCTLVQSAVLRSHIVCPSVCLSVCDVGGLWSHRHIGWNSSKIISPLVSLERSLFATLTWRVCSKGNTLKFRPKVTHLLLIWASETFYRKLRPNGYR